MVDEEEPVDSAWTLYVDGASSTKGCGAGVILEKEGDIIVKMFIKFDFPVSNNQDEYEALIAGLQLAFDVGAARLTICSDSHIVKSQASGAYQAKDPLLQKYLARVKDLMRRIGIFEIRHVPRVKNVRAN